MDERSTRRNFLGSTLAVGAAAGLMGAPTAEAARLAPKYVSVNNARRFGAKGDGKTDDTAALLRSIEKAAEDAQPVYIPPGTYITSRPLDCPPDMVLMGAGPIRTIIKASPDFRFPDGETAIIRSSGVRFASPGPSRRLTMSGIKVDGNRNTGANGILVSPQQPAYFENVRADKCPGYGLSVVDCQQMIFRNIELIDDGVGLLINSAEFLFFYDLNIERASDAFVRLARQEERGEGGAEGIRNQSIHFVGTHMEQGGADPAPFFDVQSGRALLFQNNYFSANGGTVYRFAPGAAETTEQGSTYVIIDAQVGGSPAKVRFIDDPARDLSLNAFDDFRSHIPMFIAPPLNVDPFAGPALWIAGQNGRHVKLGAAPGAIGVDSRPQAGQKKDQAVWRDAGGEVKAAVTKEGLGRFSEGVATRIVNGPVSDASFDKTPPDGTIAVDGAAGRLYVRVKGNWRSTDLG
ncbi:MAG: glycosyl hydrolase family 28-related protein [Actinomycetota bacterium]